MIAMFNQIGNVYTFCKTIKDNLARNIIDIAIETHSETLDKDSLCWRISAKQLLEKYNHDNDMTDKVIVADVINVYETYKDPNRRVKLRNKNENRSLYAEFMLITDIWGYSSWEWTPIMLRMESVFTGRNEDVLKLFEAEPFQFESKSKTVAYEFMYIQKDHKRKGNKYDFGMNGKFNATILYKDAMEYFMANIKY